MTQAAGTTTTTKEVKKLDQGVIRKRTPEGVRGGWQARLELGVQPAQCSPLRPPRGGSTTAG